MLRGKALLHFVFGACSRAHVVCNLSVSLLGAIPVAWEDTVVLCLQCLPALGRFIDYSSDVFVLVFLGFAGAFSAVLAVFVEADVFSAAFAGVLGLEAIVFFCFSFFGTIGNSKISDSKGRRLQESI